MPVAKRIALAIKRGGDLPRNPQERRAPAKRKQRAMKPQIAREEPPPLGQLPGPPETDSAPEGLVEGLLVTVNSHSIKTNGRGKYRSYMGKANKDNRTIWWSASLDKEEIPRGDDVRITGTMGAPFGKQGNIYPIRKITKIALASTPKTPEVVEVEIEEAKVSPPAADNLVQKVSALVSEYGQSKVLRALADASE
jgi:hypothetical protein